MDRELSMYDYKQTGLIEMEDAHRILNFYQHSMSVSEGPIELAMIKAFLYENIFDTHYQTLRL